MDTEWPLENHYELPNLYQTHIDEENRINEITNACESLDSNDQFAFYNLFLSKEEQTTLSLLTINENENLVIYISQSTNLQNDLYSKLEQSHIFNNPNQNKFLSHLTTRLVSNILSITGQDNAEIIFRTELPYNSYPSNNPCLYWHIDKSHGEIAKIIEPSEERPLSKDLEQKLFIIPLHGSTTLFYPATEQQKEEFFNIANETLFFYGHTSPCSSQDNINRFFNNSNTQQTPNGQGSVHLAGKTGTLHSAPPPSQIPRIILLITPF